MRLGTQKSPHFQKQEEAIPILIYLPHLSLPQHLGNFNFVHKCTATLYYGISVPHGINVPLGQIGENNKRAPWNKHAFQPKIEYWMVILTRLHKNKAKMCNFNMHLLSILDTIAKFQKYPLDKSPVLISVPYEIRACPLEKLQKINKCAGTLIP